MNPQLCIIAALCAASLIVLPAHAQTSPAKSLAFTPGTNGSFTFDTGELRGVLRAGGKSVGLQSVTHVASGRRLDASMGLLGHYRVFTTGKRYGVGAWDWPSTAKLDERGAVEVLWPANEERPFDLRAVYRWVTPSALDVETIVLAKQNLPKFESFLASYFQPGFTNALAVVSSSGDPESPSYLAAEKSAGDWQMVPRDDAAVRVIQDGRWKLPPNPVEWTIRPRFLRPVAIRCDRASNLAAVLMARQEECFTVAMPYETEGHRSLYFSLFGHDLKAGETARAPARLCVTQSMDQEQFTKLWQAYTAGAGAKP